MIQWFSKKLRNRKGFTLIELIVVIAILGILAVIAIPRLGQFRDDADNAARIANWRTVESAVQMWIVANGVPADDTTVDLAPYLNETTLVLREPPGGAGTDIPFHGSVTVSNDGSWSVVVGVTGEED